MLLTATKPTSKYLPNLDPLRFFAASVVLFYHVDNVLVFNGYKTNLLYFFPFQHGDIAVGGFFTLSGFLITYLLLLEKQQTGAIKIKTFYIKRIFRIWPLYFLVVIMAFGYFNYSPFFHLNGLSNTVDIGKNLLLNVILLIVIAPNMALLNATSLAYANPTWSIGVEEQFYALWPWVVKSRYFIKYVFLIIISMTLLSHGLISRFLNPLVSHGFLTDHSLLFKILFFTNKCFTFSFSFRIDAMAIGALGAYAVIAESKLLTTFYSRGFQLFLYMVAALLLAFPHILDYQFYAIVFTLIIINLATNPNTIVVIKNRFLNYLGRISYGIYMFHIITIIPIIRLVTDVFKLPINLSTEILICMLSLITTVVIAAISFNTFEKAFSKIKNWVLLKVGD